MWPASPGAPCPPGSARSGTCTTGRPGCEPAWPPRSSPAPLLTGLALLFAQVTQFQGYTAPGYPVVGRAYAVFDVALAVSALAAGVGGLPLWLLMLRRARREQRARDLTYLLLPVLAPAGYLAGLAVTTQLVGGPHGVSAGWFWVITLAVLAAAAVTAVSAARGARAALAEA